MDSLTLAQQLIRCPSITPQDAGVLAVLEAALTPLGFRCQRLTFSGHNSPSVDNLFACWGAGHPHIAFAGHVDVVPPGDTAAWKHDPFGGVVENGLLYGRGAVDMKSAIAAFVAAAAQVVADKPKGSISLLITCDEEGPSVNGTAPLLERLTAQGEKFDACVVGEPTSAEKFGDMIKIGRRGSLTGTITVTGKQGHVAYPERADNPVPRLLRLCRALDDAVLDTGTPEFPPSNLEIVSVDVGNPTANIIPARAQALFNVRFNSLHSHASLRQKVEHICAATGEPFELSLKSGGSEPFLTAPGKLADILAASITAVTGLVPVRSTTGGTSDARFIANYCPVIEFGLLNHTAHQVDEHVAVRELEQLTAIYERFLRDWLAAHA